MQQPLVSILMPFKNTAVYLPECLNSIITQSYSNWEVLAIDDHSTDESREVLIAFSKKDSRIQLHSNKGKGIIAALRTAFSLSKGNFITRMDSDDIMLEHKLESMTSALRKNGKGHLAIGKVRYFSEQGIGSGYARYEAWLNRLTETGINFSEIYKECVIPSPCWMTYKEDLDICGAFSPNRYPEDYDLTFRFYKEGLKCIPCSKTLHLWRDYATRTSRTSEHYAQNYFLDIKFHYFLELDHIPVRPLTVWGAGNKGKSIASKLVERNIDFYWLCDNPKKIGKKIYGQELLHYEYLKQLERPQSIITVANEEAQKMIYSYLSGLGQKTMKDYFFFC